MVQVSGSYDVDVDRYEMTMITMVIDDTLLSPL